MSSEKIERYFSPQPGDLYVLNGQVLIFIADFTSDGLKFNSKFFKFMTKNFAVEIYAISFFKQIYSDEHVKLFHPIEDCL